MNIVQLSGRLTKDMKLKAHANGSSASAYLTLAVQDDFESSVNGVKKRATQFIDAQAFVKSEKAQGFFAGFKKGDFVEVTARMKSVRYKDANGKDVYSQILDVVNIKLIAKASTNNDVAKTEPATNVEPNEAPKQEPQVVSEAPTNIQLDADPFKVNVSEDALPF